MTARPIHFEIHVDDMSRAQAFYAEVFGWGFEDYSEYTGQPYFGVVTGSDEAPGINGGMMMRRAPLIADNPVGSAVLTMGVESFDETAEAVLRNGGSVALPKYALPGMAWQGYFTDTEGNIFGIHQPDETAS